MLFAQTGLTAINLDIKQQSAERRKTYLFQGIVFAIGGILAVAASVFSNINAAVLIGCILLVTGLIQYLVARDLKMHWWAQISAVFSILCGLLILWHPVTGLTIAVTVMAVFFAIEAIVELFLGYHFQCRGRWAWIYLSGVITLGMAAMLALGHSTFGPSSLGWVIAINFIPYGSWLLMMAQQRPRFSWNTKLPLLTGVVLTILVSMSPVFAQTQGKHALGDMYTKALNILGSRGMLNTLEPKKNARIGDIHVDHGLVVVRIIKEGNSQTVNYDMLSNRLLPENQTSQIN